MAKITRKTALIFGSSASAGDIRQFGSLAAGSPVTTTDPDTIQALANWLTGWLGAVIGGNSPTIEDMNAMCYVFAYQIAYLMQTGVPEWETSTIYFIGNVVNDGSGGLYISRTDSNTGNALTSTTNWQKIAGTNTVQTKSADYTMLPSDTIVLASGTHTITMPNATVCTGSEFIVKKTDSGTTTSIAFQSAQSADGQTSLSLTEQYSFYRFMSNGTNLDIIGWG